MTTAPLRKDAARNWERIVAVARDLVAEGTPLQLNDIARRAGMGVGTVYRHFPTAEALLETVAAPGLEALAGHGEQALADDDAGRALAGFLARTVEAQVTDAALAPVTAAPADALPRTTELKRTLRSVGRELLERARDARVVRADLSADDLVPLMCGIAYAAQVHADPAARVETARRYLTALLEGLYVG
ncbi:TetR family transcriptional regulator [Streptomyces sp. SID486]|uniref:TetR/AcrR family transcriptional regulator n=1 Tax=unclassified Streptomyces TaxID=2593676 RepID=UPI00136FC6E6|nr:MULTISPECIES: TetR/AcrR family transcriptional regulator [unclassified Streptomyces]MYW18508.1 TetR family transcriptional regulator [Streptomyces sp. SID2955]MYW45251.1 TetR family transcriptional regulator [Streptomyces sp. SID161]MYX96393.1 TetR family transcriptional regulator [Streptomyces sp. SID486]